MFGQISDQFASAGISAEYVTIAVVLYLIISTVWTMFLWAFCYLFNPIRRVLSRIPLEFIQKRIKNGQVYDEKYFKWLPQRVRGKAALALCEMFVMKSITAPLILPLKVWATVVVLRDSTGE